MPQYIFFYKFVTRDTPHRVLYVGSTTNFNSRANVHQRYVSKSNSNLYQTIRSLGGWNKLSMQLIEHALCIDHEHRLAREQYWIEQYRHHPLANSRNAYTGGIAI